VTCLIRPSLIRIKMDFQQQWYFFWFLYMLEDDCKKQKISKKGKSASTGPSEILSAPLWVQMSKFSELYDVGILNLYLRMPGTLQKESAQSDHPAWRKRSKRGPILLFQNIPIFMYVLDVFSGQGNRMELIPFALCQASRDTSLEYPHHIIPRTFKFRPEGGPTKFRGALLRHFSPFSKIFVFCNHLPTYKGTRKSTIVVGNPF
jgi:hypothetical protein